LHGSYSGALAIARALEPVAKEPGFAPQLQAVIARAAAGLNDRVGYADAAARVDELLSDPAIPADVAARSLLSMAHAALTIGEPDAAAAYADEAMSIGRRRSENRVALEAEAVLDAARTAARAEKVASAASSPAPPALANDFVRALGRVKTQAAGR
jgi:hypothetical protein